MTELLDELLVASFNGAVFLISNSSTRGGRKDALHEYPNSDRQRVEDLGLRPRSYKITGFITGPDYIAKRDRLLEALESGVTGVLSHPFYGEIPNMKARPYSIDENLQNLGRAEVSMLFDYDDTPGAPVETQDTLNLVFTSNDGVQTAAGDSIANNYDVNPGFAGNFSAGQSKLSNLETAFITASSVVVKLTSQIDEYNAQVSNFGEDINRLILQPRELADSLVEIGYGMNALYATERFQLTAWRELFGFGDNDIVDQHKTVGTASRTRSNEVINRSVQSQALGFAYLAAAQVDYQTTDALDTVVNILETQYQKILSDVTIDQTLRVTLTDMRENTNSFFVQQRVTLQRIISIVTPTIPARVLSYQYYANSNLGGSIAALNNDANVSFIGGDIEILTQ